MKIIKAKPGDFIVAGQQGEELARRVEFDIAEWERLYGPGTVQLLVKRMTDETFYPVAIKQEQGVAIWAVTVPETSVAGKYHTYELRYYAGETLAKAVGGRFSINEAFVGEEGEVPEVHQGWVDQIIATGAESLAAQIAAEAARDGAIEAQLNANLANTEAQTAKQEAANYAESALKAENNAKEYAKIAKTSKEDAEIAALNSAASANESEKFSGHSYSYSINASNSAKEASRDALSADQSAAAAKASEVSSAQNAANAKTSEQNAMKAANEAAESAQGVGDTKIAIEQAIVSGVETIRSEADSQVDWLKQEVSSQAKRAETAANAAEVSEKNAKTSEANSANSEAEAKKAAAEATQMRNDALSYKVDASNAAQDAKNAKAGAEQYAQNASNSESNASQYAATALAFQGSAVSAMRNAEAARDQAQTFAQAASNFSVRAKESEEAAKQSEVNAAKSAQEAKEAAQNAGGGVSSWNDLTDKPFYEESNVVDILPETEATEVTYPTFGRAWLIATAPALAIGETYTVVYNGEAYQCVGMTAPEGVTGDPDAVALGNFAVVGGTDTGEPFAILVMPNVGNILAVDLTGAASVTISIRQEQTTIVPLPTKYLPKGVPYVGEAEVPFDFTFDGDTTGKEVIEVYEGVGYVKVADIVLTRDDLTNAVMTMMSADEEIIYEFDLESIIDMNGDGSIFGGGEYVLAVQRDSEISGLAFAPGLYFINYPGMYLVKSLIKEGATVTEEVINKLDSRCLPDTVATKADIFGAMEASY